MKPKTALILAVIAAVLLVYVIWFEIRGASRWPSTKERKAQLTLVFPALAADADKLVEKVTRVRIERPEGTVELVRTESGWELAPSKEPASKTEVDSYVTSLLRLAKEEKGVESPGEPGQYGLAEPRVKVRFLLEGKEHEVDFGSAIPAADQVYAKLPGTEAVMVVQKYAFDRVAKSADDFRERRFLAFLPGNLHEIQLASDKGEITLVQKDPYWWVTVPVSDRADALRIDDLVRKLGELEAAEFVTPGEDLAQYGLAPPAERVTLISQELASGAETPGQTKTTIQKLFLGKVVGDRPGFIYAMLEGGRTIYVVKDEIVSRVAVGPDFYRDHLLARFTPYDAERLEIKGPGNEVVCEKKDDNWKLTKPAEIAAHEMSMDNFLQDLTGLAIVRYVADKPTDLAQYGLAEPEAIQISVGVKGRPAQDFRFGKVDEKQKDLYAQRVGEDNIFTVKESWLAMAKWGPLELRTRTVAEINRYDIRKMTIITAERTVTVAKTEDKWFMTEPIKAPTYEVAVSAILNDVDRVHAERFLASSTQDAAKYGLDKPTVRVVMELKKADAEPTTEELLLGNKLSEGGYAAQVKGKDVLFVAADTVYEHLTGELHDPKVWGMKLDNLSEITWKKDDLEVLMRKEDNQWKLIRPDNLTLDAQKASSLALALTNLETSHYLSYHSADAAKSGLDKPVLSVTVKTDAGQETLVMGPADSEGKSAAMVVGREGVFQLGASTTKLLTEGMTPPTGAEQPAPAPEPAPAPPAQPAPPQPAQPAPVPAPGG